MTEQLEAVLSRAGWTAQRAVDVAKHEQALITAGFAVWPELRAFLREFGGLTLHFDRHGREDTLWFDGTRVATLADPGWVAMYETHLDVMLAPVGLAHNDHMTVMASRTGSFFGGYDGSLGQLGQDATEALAALVEDRVQPFTSVRP